MKIINEVDVPARVETMVVGMQCDLCGKRSVHSGSWATENFELAETKVSCREGMSYPEGGSGREYEIDLCMACFKTKLIPWLTFQGARLSAKEWDY